MSKARNSIGDDRSRSLGFDRLRIEDASKGDAENALVPKKERAFLIGICKPGDSLTTAQEHLEELEMLAETAGAEIVDKELVKLRSIDPALYMGKGKAAEIAGLVAEVNADLVVFDEDPAPAQARNPNANSRPGWWTGRDLFWIFLPSARKLAKQKRRWSLRN